MIPVDLCVPLRKHHSGTKGDAGDSRSSRSRGHLRTNRAGHGRGGWVFTRVVSLVIIFLPLSGVLYLESLANGLHSLASLAFLHQEISLFCIGLSELGLHVQEFWVLAVDIRKSLDHLVPIHPPVAQSVQILCGKLDLFLQVLVFRADFSRGLQIPHTFLDVPLFDELPAEVYIRLKQKRSYIALPEIRVDFPNSVEVHDGFRPIALVESRLGILKSLIGSLIDRSRRRTGL